MTVRKMKRFFLLLVSTTLFAAEGGDNYHFSGKHFLASYLGCNIEALAHVDNLLQAMHEAVHASGATVLNWTPHIFPPDALTVVYLLSESHASIHTYPEHGACFVDLFTCGNRPMAEKFDEVLRAYLQPTEVNARLFLRSENIAEAPYLPTTTLAEH